ncbi:MAG: outer membrane protein transport protein [Myxococcota bacterium]
MPLSLRAVLTGALALSVPSLASAGGFFVGDVGARGLGRAGAFIAAPDSVLALHYNPAGLSLLSEGLHVEVDMSTVSLDYSFKRTCPCVAPTTANAASLDATLAASPAFAGVANNSAGVQIIPYISAAYQLPWKHLTLAAAVYAMTSPGKLRYGERGQPASDLQPQRYSLVDLDLYEAYYNLGVSIEPVEGLRIGFVGQIYDFKVTQAVHLWANTTFSSTPEDADLDIPIVLAFHAPLRPNYAFGVSWTPTFLKELSFGFSMLGKRDSRSEGTTSFTLSPTLAPLAQITGSKVGVELTLPAMLRGGIQFAIPQTFAAEVAVEVETWSGYKQVTVRPQDIQVTLGGTTQPLAKVILPTNFQNTISLRAGGELNIWEPYLTLRAGYSFETGALAETFIDPSTADLSKHGIHFGAGTTWAGVSLQAGVAYFVMPSLSTTTSGKRLIGPLEAPQGAGDYLTYVGNGTYSGSYFLFSASVAVALDPLMKAI